MARRYPRAPNLRQVHLIPSETLEAVRAAGYNIGPGELGENITTSGLDLENLPVDAEIRLGASARIRLTGLRTPCVLIDRFPPGLKGRLMCEGPHPPFKAGVMSIVIESGEVVTGDSVWTFLPTAPHRPLPPL